MRNAFAQIVTELAVTNPRLVLLAGDIGNRLFDRFKEQFPQRFYNCGVAEAGMTGIAAGLASSGLQPITYTITPFNTLRCLEQIRLDVCYPDLPVILVGTGSGLSYASLGATHHSMEDIGALRMLPNMHVVCPADTMEVKSLIAAALELRRPTYIRLGKKGEPQIHHQPPALVIGKSYTIREGSDLAVIGVGNLLAEALKCADLLQEKSITTRVISWHTVKPIDDSLLSELFASFAKIIVLEEHGYSGGVGSSLLEWGSRQGVDLRKLKCFAGADQFLSACGNQQQAREFLGLTANQIVPQLLEWL